VVLTNPFDVRDDNTVVPESVAPEKTGVMRVGLVCNTTAPEPVEEDANAPGPSVPPVPAFNVAVPSVSVPVPVVSVMPFTVVGVMAPSVSVMAGVVVGVATTPDTPLAVVTLTEVTEPVPDGIPLSNERAYAFAAFCAARADPAGSNAALEDVAAVPSPRFNLACRTFVRSLRLFEASR
jgi:hypothetical protein